MKCAQVRRAARGEDVGGRHGGAKRRQRSNLGQTWKKNLSNQKGGGDGEREKFSRIQGNLERQRSNLGCW